MCIPLFSSFPSRRHTGQSSPMTVFAAPLRLLSVLSKNNDLMCGMRSVFWSWIKDASFENADGLLMHVDFRRVR